MIFAEASTMLYFHACMLVYFVRRADTLYIDIASADADAVDTFLATRLAYYIYIGKSRAADIASA